MRSGPGAGRADRRYRMRRAYGRPALTAVLVLGAAVFAGGDTASNANNAPFGGGRAAGAAAWEGRTEHGAMVLGTRYLQSCRHGYFMLPRHDTMVGRSLHIYGEWSEHEVALFTQLLAPFPSSAPARTAPNAELAYDDAGPLVVYDVGANLGAFTIPLARMVSSTPSGGRVVAFEAQRELSGLLSASVELNELGRAVDLRRCIVANSSGSVVVPVLNLSRPSNFGSFAPMDHATGADAEPDSDASFGAGEFDTVEQVTLDSVYLGGGVGDGGGGGGGGGGSGSDGGGGGGVGDGGGGDGHGADGRAGDRRCPRLIKIDVEGMEMAVLGGASVLLRECQHATFLHVENNCKKTSRELIELLTGYDYHLYWDVRPLYNPDNYLRNPHDVFTDSLVSMNVLAVPARENWRYSFQNFVRIEVELEGGEPGHAGRKRGYYLEEYALTWKDSTAVIRQHGDEHTCVR